MSSTPVYTSSADRGTLAYGVVLAIEPYQALINNLARSAISSGISDIDARDYVEEHRAELDRTAHVLIGLFHLPQDGLDLIDLAPANSDAMQQQADESHDNMNGQANGNANGNANGHVNGHANGHANDDADAANSHDTIVTDSDEAQEIHDLLLALLTDDPTVVLQQHGAQDANGHGTSNTLGASDSNLVHQSDDTLNFTHTGHSSAHGNINSGLGGVDLGAARLSPGSTPTSTVTWNAARLPLDFGR